MARPAAAFDQTVPIENRVDGALGRNPNIAIEAPNQELADLARAPMRLLGFELDNQGLDLSRQLIGIAYRAFGAVVQRLKPVFLVAIKDLVAGLPRNAEIPADVRHCLPVQQPGDKPQALLHHRTRFPRHQHLPPTKGEKCYPCVRYEVSPMSRAAHLKDENCLPSVSNRIFVDETGIWRSLPFVGSSGFLTPPEPKS